VATLAAATIRPDNVVLLRRLLFVAFVVIASCGGRTQLGSGGDAGPDAHVHDGGKDSGVVQLDAGEDATSDCGFDQDPSPGATSSYGACGEGVNITSPPADNVAGAGAAFEYVPQTDIVIERIELHTTGGSVGLLDSDCEQPGTVLFYGPLETSATPAWVGADVFPVIPVKAGHRYFIYEKTDSSGADSAATGGVYTREYTTPNGVNGPWGGPFDGIFWSARLDGVCP